jgi:hypothetical protein
VNCQKCGTPMSESAEFCPACGAQSYNTAPSKPAPPPEHKRQHPEKAEYPLNVECNNCDYSGRLLIPIGTPASGYNCPNCGCAGFMHKVKKDSA